MSICCHHLQAAWTPSWSTLSNRHWEDKVLDILVFCFLDKWAQILCLEVENNYYSKKWPFKSHFTSFFKVLSRDRSCTGRGEVSSLLQVAVCLAYGWDVTRISSERSEKEVIPGYDREGPFSHPNPSFTQNLPSSINPSYSMSPAPSPLTLPDAWDFHTPLISSRFVADLFLNSSEALLFHPNSFWQCKSLWASLLLQNPHWPHPILFYSSLPPIKPKCCDSSNS